jgi:hypothetical protein
MALVLLGTSGCPPEVTSFSPASGKVGATVTITGKNFADNAAGNVVKFNGKAATAVTMPDADKLVAVVPADATTGRVTVTVGTQTGTSATDFTVETEQQGGTGKKWTFMVYLDADNNLESDGLNDFKEMAKVGSSGSVNIVVQMDRIQGETGAYGDWADTRRFLVGLGDDPAVPPLQNLGEQNMGDPAVLTDFVKWAVSSYPAEHYALIVWNHGGGWRDMMMRAMGGAVGRAPGAPAGAPPATPVVKAVAVDDTDGDMLYMREVQTAIGDALVALGPGRKLDIVGFDACLMGMVEVAYALRDVALYVVGSEESEPGSGWPYDKILGPLAANPAKTPAELATDIVHKYADSYDPNNPDYTSITQSAVDISKLGTLASKIDAFTAVAVSEWDKLKAARSNSLAYHPSGSPYFWGTDLWDFADEVWQRAAAADLKSAAAGVKAAVEDFVIAERHGTDAGGSHGVAIYFPPSASAFNNDPEHTGYAQDNNTYPVDFVKQHAWDEWLVQFHQH